MNSTVIHWTMSEYPIMFELIMVSPPVEMVVNVRQRASMSWTPARTRSRKLIKLRNR